MFRSLISNRFVMTWVLGLCLCSTGSVSAQVDFEFRAPIEALYYDETTGAGFGSYPIMIFENPTLGSPHGVTAWSMSVTHDPMYLTPTAIEQSAYLASINGGAGPALFTPNLSPVGGAGITCGAIYDFLGTTLCFYDVPEESLVITYETVASSLAGDTVGLSTPIGWTLLGNPLIENAIFENGAQTLASTVDGSLTLIPTNGFIRGDANNDSSLSAIVDGVAILDHLFNNVATTCRDSMDANDDGSVNVLDAVHMFQWGFINGPAPAAPFPNCGMDPTPMDGETCAIPYC